MENQKTFGRLTIVDVAEDQVSPCGTRHKMYRCVCSCGKEVIVRKSALVSGKTVSCGCYNIERSTKHGQKGTRLYNIWNGMKRRCYGNHKESHNYKENGITVCDEWKNDFKVFYDWAMSHGYSDDLTIDRINCNGNYEPSNCRWVTMKVQQNNRRNNHTILIDGIEESIVDYAEKNGLNLNSVRSVLYRNRNNIQKIRINGKERGEHICLICTKDMFQLNKRSV